MFDYILIIYAYYFAIFLYIDIFVVGITALTSFITLICGIFTFKKKKASTIFFTISATLVFVTLVLSTPILAFFM